VADAAAPVAEEAPVKPKRTRTRKVAAVAPEAPAAEAAAAAEEAPAKPKRTRTRKAVAAVETPEA
ncbi:DNA helicase, partial [Streptomyces sp. NPDC006450]